MSSPCTQVSAVLDQPRGCALQLPTAQACLVQCLTPLRLRLLQCACLAPLVRLGRLLQLSCALSRLEEAACRQAGWRCSSPDGCLQAACMRRAAAEPWRPGQADTRDYLVRSTRAPRGLDLTDMTGAMGHMHVLGRLCGELAEPGGMSRLPHA